MHSDGRSQAFANRPKADERNHLLQAESRQLSKVSPIHEVLRHLQQQE